jgi:hypothetical protein
MHSCLTPNDAGEDVPWSQCVILGQPGCFVVENIMAQVLSFQARRARDNSPPDTLSWVEEAVAFDVYIIGVFANSPHPGRPSLVYQVENAKLAEQVSFDTFEQALETARQIVEGKRFRGQTGPRAALPAAANDRD